MMKVLFVSLVFLFPFVASAQNLKTVEQSLLKQFKKIDYWANYEGNSEQVSAFDSLESANVQFKKKLLKYTSQHAFTLTASFKELEKEGLRMATSPDGIFKIYSWDTWTGGTMHFFDNVYQYKSGNQVFSKTLPPLEEGDPGFYYSAIYALKNDDKTYYLAVNHAVYSSRDSYQGIKVFGISNNKLNDQVKIIKTKTGLRNHLGFEFDFLSVMDRKERPVKLLEYDAAKKLIRIPVVLEDGTVTKKWIVYQFTGQYFERK